MAKNGVYSCSFQESAIFNPYFQTIAEKLFIMYLGYAKVKKCWLLCDIPLNVRRNLHCQSSKSDDESQGESLLKCVFLSFRPKFSPFRPKMIDLHHRAKYLRSTFLYAAALCVIASVLFIFHQTNFVMKIQTLFLLRRAVPGAWMLGTWAFTLSLLLSSSFSAFAQTPTMPKEPSFPEYSLTGIGLYGGADYRTMTMKTPSFQGFPTCCVQDFGSVQALGWLAGVNFDHTLTNWLLVDVRAHVFSTQARFTQNEQVFVGVSGMGQNVPIRHTMDISLMNLALEPSLKMRLFPIPITTTFAPSLYLQLGVNAATTLQSRFSYEERIASENSPVNFIDNAGRVTAVRNQQQASIPQLSPLQLALFGGLETEIYLEQLFPANWILTPFVRYYYPLTGITLNELQWSNALQAGLGVKYRFITEKQSR